MTSPLDGVANNIVKIIVRQWSDAFPIYLQDHITIFTKYISTAIFYMSRETTAHTIDRYHLYYTSLNHTNIVPPYLSLQRLLHQDCSLTMYVPVYGDINNPPTWQMQSNVSLHTCDSPIPQVCELIVFGWNQTSIDITLSGGSSGFHILWTTWSAGTNQMDGLPTPIYNLQPLFSTKQPLPSPMIYHNSSLVHPNPRQH